MRDISPTLMRSLLAFSMTIMRKNFTSLTEDEREDIAIECVVKFAKYPKHIDYPDTFMYRVVVRQVLDYARKKARVPKFTYICEATEPIANPYDDVDTHCVLEGVLTSMNPHERDALKAYLSGVPKIRATKGAQKNQSLRNTGKAIEEAKRLLKAGGVS